MTLSEFRMLDPKRIGSWPLLAKLLILLLVFSLIVGAGWYFGWLPQTEDLEKRQGEETALRKQFVDKKTQAVNLDLHVKQLADIEKQFGTLLRQLPSKNEMDGLLSDINQAGTGRGLQFDLFRPASQEKIGDFYAELPIDIRVTGTYQDIGAFTSDVAKMPRIVTLSGITLAPTKDGTQLQMDAVARTYRYLDDDEIAKKRKAELDAKKK
jgi:type IV pilus assembly protein PilO